MTTVTNTMNTNIEVNKALHLALGKCWHEPVEVQHNDCWPRYDCAACGKAELSGYMSHRPEGAVFIPTTDRLDYTNDLNAVAEAERWVIEKVGQEKYVATLFSVLNDKVLLAEGKTNWRPIELAAVIDMVKPYVATAKASDRAAACLRALDVEVKDV